MRLTKQIFRHDPENGVYGDCYRTAIACLLDLDPQDVPHEHRDLSGDEHVALYKDWLHARGLFRVAVPMQCDSVAWALQVAAHWSDGLPYIFTGTSRTGVNHCVVGQADKIIHDPSQTEAGIVGPCQPDGYYWVEWIVIPAEGRKPDRASVDADRPAGAPAAREAEQ